MAHQHQIINKRLENKSRLWLVLVIICSFMIVELIAGLAFHSLALLADAGHMLADVAALILALLASWFATKPATTEKTYGYYRSEILASFINAIILVAIALAVLLQAYERLQKPPEVAAIPVFCVAFLGLFINLIALRLLHGSQEESLNMRAAYLEILSDSITSVGVMASSLIIYFTHWNAADAVISALIGLVILPRTWVLLRECTNILMEGVPGRIDLASLRKALLSIEGVIEVHDLHVWTISSGLDSMSGHVRISPKYEAEKVLDAVTKVLNDDFELHHTTIQVEQAACDNQRNVCSP